MNNHSLNSSNYSIQTRVKKLVEEFSYQKEIIIDELLSLLENAEQKGIKNENHDCSFIFTIFKIIFI